MRRFLLAALLLFMTAGARAAAPDGDVFDHPGDAARIAQLLAGNAGQLRQAQVLRGSFVQRKTLREIPRPLVSSGDFLFARDTGIYWHTRQPLDSAFILTAAGMVQQDGGGTAQRVSSEQQPGLKAAASIFFAMFAMDLKALSADFDLFGAGDAKHWQVGLRPRGAMAAVFREAVISGGGTIEQVLMHDSNGDVTEIGLQQPQISKAPLSAAEKQRIGFQ